MLTDPSEVCAKTIDNLKKQQIKGLVKIFGAEKLDVKGDMLGNDMGEFALGSGGAGEGGGLTFRRGTEVHCEGKGEGCGCGESLTLPGEGI